jgi:hypothetical protein
MTKKAPRGYLMLLALVFGAIFLTVLGALSTFALTQNRLQVATEGRAKALALSEAGLEYYRWFLAHYPGNITNNTGVAGPYVLTYNDPEAGPVGTASLAITGNQACGQTTSIDIVSTGRPSDGSNAKRSIYARYAEPTVANYSFILNDSVWAGADRIINGPYHSNGGVRMDGTANSGVSSSLSTWTCTSSFGCSPDTVKPGVFGAGPNQSLWKNSKPQVDFSGIATDFASLKAIAQSSGAYLPRISTGNGTAVGNANTGSYWNGYHLIFNANGTVTIKKVTGTTNLTLGAQLNVSDPITDHTKIATESTFQTYTLPIACGLIFVEDNVWVEGVIPQKVTIIAANTNPALPGVVPNAMLRNNITYTGVGTGLTLIAQNDVLITADSPAVMVLNGIFIAQTGAFGRNYYGNNCSGTYEPRTSLTIHGTTVSYKRTGTRWQNGCNGGSSDAGYQSRVDGFDRALATDPPPFTPVLTTDYQFVDWREQ